MCIFWQYLCNTFFTILWHLFCCAEKRASFEPKLKAVRLSHVDDEPVARVDSSADTNAHEKTDFSGCSSVQT